MVEFHVSFETENDAIHGDDYLDLMLFAREPFTRILTDAGFKDMHDHVGFTPEMNDIVNEQSPPDLQEPWSDDMYNWTEPETALAMWALLRAAVQTRPELFREWPGMADEAIETLDIADRVFGRARDRGARWFIPAPGF